MAEAVPAGACGLDCSVCRYRGSMCAGCGSTEGGAFWCTGDVRCRVYSCVRARQLEQCGLCQEFPCQVLLEFVYDPEHGGRVRLGNCVVRARLGTAAWAAREAEWHQARAGKTTS